MLKDIPIPADLLKIICGMVTDKTFVRLTSLSKELTKHRHIIPLKKVCNFSLYCNVRDKTDDEYCFSFTNMKHLKYLTKKAVFNNRYPIIFDNKHSVKEITLNNIHEPIVSLPTNITKLYLNNVKQDIANLPRSILGLGLFSCSYINLPENLIRLEIDNTIKIKKIPPKLLYLLIKFLRFDPDGAPIIFKFPKLPTSLQCLIVIPDYYYYNYPKKIPLTYDKHFFPPNLKKLVLDKVNFEMQENTEIELPDTLETIYLNIHKACKLKIKRLPLSIKKLYLEKCNPFIDMSSQSLKYLGYEEANIKYIPDCVEVIDFSNNISIFINNIPKSLKKIYIGPNTIFLNIINLAERDFKNLLKLFNFEGDVIIENGHGDKLQLL